MTVIERYENFIVNIEEHQKVLKAELAELSIQDLTTDERDYMNDLMSLLKRGNLTISSAEHEIKRLKRDESVGQIGDELTRLLNI